VNGGVNVNEAAVKCQERACMTDEASPRSVSGTKTAPPRTTAAVTGSNQDSHYMYCAYAPTIAPTPCSLSRAHMSRHRATHMHHLDGVTLQLTRSMARHPLCRMRHLHTTCIERPAHGQRPREDTEVVQMLAITSADRQLPTLHTTMKRDWHVASMFHGRAASH